MGMALMSIRPVYVEKILSGQKRFEYRKVPCKRKIERILIYSTAPIMKVVGEVEVTEVLTDTPSRIWEKTKLRSGISRDFFDQYFNGRQIAVAYALGKVTEYKSPRNLVDFGIKTAPQSFVYLDTTSVTI